MVDALHFQLFLATKNIFYWEILDSRLPRTASYAELTRLPSSCCIKAEPESLQKSYK